MVIMNSIIRDQGERGVSLLSDTMSAFSTSQRLDWPEEAGAGTLRLFNLGSLTAATLRGENREMRRPLFLVSLVCLASAAPWY